jgi:plasmid stabilization system protein ParE
MRLTYTQEALEELIQAVKYYRLLDQTLAAEFLQRLQAAEEDIISHPEAWQNLGGPWRRRRLKQFPYGMVYHLAAPGWLEVVAVMHLHREPDYWRGRKA